MTYNVQNECTAGTGTIQMAEHSDVHQMTALASGPFQAPKPSRAMRKIARKTSNQVVGELTFGEELGRGQTLAFESKLEHDVALLTIYRPGVIDVCEQVEVPFVKSNGKIGRHFIDFIATEASGRRTAILVKRSDRAIRAGFLDEAARVAHAAIPHIAHRVVIATEKIIERDMLVRAEQYHASRFAQPIIDRQLAAAAQELVDPTTISGFLAMAGLGCEGFHGVIRMVRFQKLEALHTGLLTLSSPVRPVEATS
ncbi:hypothetical protein [Marivita sp. GX14005]|uniref:hypothetical protein n=1 Tax=Marivita sp. GX14005 TaxID=2942276 RepID=UPI00201904E8|nr:hypothetical protein [Marivita sp. GX14005]MCL3883571.1 hypothetical protein [Marivita sp. GX14005]